jgi:predicted HTH transcriptional regulator
MKIFKGLEFVEHLGLGMPKIIGKYGQEAVKLGGCTLKMTLSFDRDMGDEKIYPDAYPDADVSINVILNDKQQKILDLIRNIPKITAQEIAEKIGLSERRVYSNIKSLSDAKLIERKGSKKSGYWEIIE